jgi:cardiolipin synthase
MLIVDSKVCFYGSSNITEEYLQINTNRNIFFDINYIITGKIINSLIDTFIYNFKKYTNASEEVKKQLKFRKAIENKDNGSSTQLVLGYPDCKYDNINFSVLSIINTAKKSITIVNPFLLPTNEIVQALKIAA